jgi:hypothetical protein
MISGRSTAMSGAARAIVESGVILVLALVVVWNLIQSKRVEALEKK